MRLLLGIIWVMEKTLNGKIGTPTKSPSNKRLANLKPAWKKGDPSPNPNGRPTGQRNYDTIRREALIAIGQKNGKTPEEIENMLIEAGLSQAMRGDFRYYKDDLDRKYGQATQKHEMQGDLIIKIVDYKKERA